MKLTIATELQMFKMTYVKIKYYFNVFKIIYIRSELVPESNLLLLNSLLTNS